MVLKKKKKVGTKIKTIATHCTAHSAGASIVSVYLKIHLNYTVNTFQRIYHNEIYNKNTVACKIKLIFQQKSQFIKPYTFFFFYGPQIKSASVDIQIPLDGSSIR